ncbi:type 1 glutamine amidotransferase domain-containing protein [Cyanothece sp. BG0011]|uniref:type 1 glutamine amidotransferase domain-containing protein n=1 Tax=Cyanothece sp. BG0011 TaxID=2082950 RepID=UPI000D1F99CF|nr:type 1 glutamine amidotransferase domain-containing protein [Cyanothece sp. BG0011]
MAKELQNKKIAILVTDGFEQVEMTQPRQAFDDAGATTHLISPKDQTVRGWNHYDKADEFNVDIGLNQANPNDYDALLLPGGVANPDQLRTNESVVEFIKAFFTADKPVAAICHGPWTLVEAEAVEGRKITSWPSLKTDLKNAGANWVDQEVVIDGNLVTSRNPHDIPAFINAAIALFARVTATA